MKLTDICDFQGGSQPPKEEWSFDEQEGYIRMLQIRDFTQSERVTPEYIKISNTTKTCEADDILIARYGASIGKILTGLAGAYNVAIMRTIPDTSKIKKKYLYYYLKSPYFQNAILNVGSRAAQAGFNKEDLSKLDIICPELLKQDEIIVVLEKLEAIIEKRKLELSSLDDLIKARFIELFGDPVIHLDKGETVKLDTIADKITVGFVGEASNEYVDEGVPYLRTQNVRVNRIDLNGLIYVSEAFHNKNQKSIIHPGDVVISRVGVNRGMAAMVPDSLPEANIANCLIVGKTENINSYYLAFYMNMSFGKRPQFGASVGSAQGVVNTSILKKWEVYVPDRHMQDEFFEFAKQVDKSKFAVQKSLEETHTLFDSLMQQYFG